MSDEWKRHFKIRDGCFLRFYANFNSSHLTRYLQHYDMCMYMIIQIPQSSHVGLKVSTAQRQFLLALKIFNLFPSRPAVTRVWFCILYITTCLNAWNSISDNFILLVKVVMAQLDLKWVIQFLKLFFKARILLIVFTHVICDTKINYRHRWIKSTHHISHIVFKHVIAYWSNMLMLNTHSTTYTFLLIFCYFKNLTKLKGA